MVPVDPPGSGKAAAQACLCIRPSGRLYRVDCGGGWPQVYPGRMEIRVQSAGPGPGPTYLVSVGSSSIARVQGE